MLDKERLINLLGHTEVEDLKGMLCKWLECGCPEEADPKASDPKPPATSSSSRPASSPTLPVPIAINRGAVQGDSYTFMVNLAGPAGTEAPQLFLLDTGAFEMLLSESAASALGLPNEGAVTIEGVTGNAAAYNSHVTVKFSDTVIFDNVACVIMPDLQSDALFGFRFWLNRGLMPMLNPAQGWLAIYQAKDWQVSGESIIPA